ncbi:MAG: hypothetical protein JRF63_00690 [Deltaproteobacteria bacterium]|nr:hypothetical protein [Deltaproteobacteria bacterium]
MTQAKDNKIAARLVGLVFALVLSAVAQKCAAGEIELLWDASSLDIGYAAEAPGSSSLFTGCAIGLFCQPLRETLPGYGFAANSGTDSVLCLVSMLADASLVLARAVDHQLQRGSNALVEFWTSPYEKAVALMPALSTIKYDNSIVGLAIGINGTF